MAIDPNRLHVVRALYGDALVLEYDDKNGESGFILVDGGPDKAYRYEGQMNRLDTTGNLYQLLNHLSSAGRGTRKLNTINTLVVTHDDSDHKNGIARLFYDLTKWNKTSKSVLRWEQGSKKMGVKQPPVENIWYNSQEGLTYLIMKEADRLYDSKILSKGARDALLQKLKNQKLIDSKTSSPVLGWFGMFLKEYNDQLNTKVYFDREINQPIPTVLPEYKIIGRQSIPQSITKGAITVDILGPHISWSDGLTKPLTLSKVILLILLAEVKKASESWSENGGIESTAKQMPGGIDVEQTASQDLAPRNSSSIVFRANYKRKDGKGKKQGVLMLGDAPMTKILREQVAPSNDMEYAIVKVGHHGSAHNNFVKDDYSKYSWVKLDTSTVLHRSYLYFLEMDAPKYVISASTLFQPRNPHITTILAIYFAAAAKHMMRVSLAGDDVPDKGEWKVDVYMTGNLSPEACELFHKFIDTPQDVTEIKDSDFVVSGKSKTNVIKYIQNYKSHMTIWKLKGAYGSIGVLGGSTGDKSHKDQWEEYDVYKRGEKRKQVNNNTGGLGLAHGNKKIRPSNSKKMSFNYF